MIKVYISAVDHYIDFNEHGDILNLAEIRANFTRTEQSYYAQVPSEMLYADGEPVLVLREEDAATKFDEMFSEEAIYAYKVYFLTGVLQHSSPASPLFEDMRKFVKAFREWNDALKAQRGKTEETL